jgi:hypothetical protein
MILALILTCAAALSSAVPAPLVDSAAISPISLVPLNKSSSPSLAIPEPNYRPPDTTSRNRDGIVSEPTRKEIVPGFVSQSLVSVAILTTGVMLTGAGIAYWQHAQAANDAARKAGVNPFGLMAVATVSIPVGAVVAVFGGLSLIGDIGSIGSSD